MNSKKTKSIGQKAAETAAKTGASGFDNNTGFKLDEKITVEGICTKLLCAGYVQAHIDFFYLFNKNSNIKVPSSITPGEKFKQQYLLNRNNKDEMPQDE